MIELQADIPAVLTRVQMRDASRRAMRKAGRTAVRDMGSAARKEVRQRKRLKLRIVRKAMRTRLPRGTNMDSWEWSLDIDGEPVPLSAYRHWASRRGVRVEVNPGRRTLLPHAFQARMSTGHQGIFERKGRARLPIRERMGSRPVDALHQEATQLRIAERGARTMDARFPALMDLEVQRMAARPAR